MLDAKGCKSRMNYPQISVCSIWIRYQSLSRCLSTEKLLFGGLSSESYTHVLPSRGQMVLLLASIPYARDSRDC
ncbi:hypothetical protein B0G82_7825 [Paraburkholderia sp. BL17N1]|nr:hypothetical protein B0G82_7825 [Paraburkholderia sp. BL17N1]